MLGAALTALLLLFAVSASGVSAASAYKPVVIANGWSPSDVGTAAPLAASLGGSVLYANAGSLGDPTVDALTQIKPSAIILVGGTAALSADIETELAQMLPGVPVMRLAGDDRIHTAALAALHTLGSAVPIVTDTGAQDTASTGPGDAQDYQTGYSETRFRVGSDLLPGVYEFSDGSGVGRLSGWTRNARGYDCRHSFGEDGSDAARFYVVVNGEPVRGVYESGVSTFRFGLVDSDIVTLQAAAGDICEIERVHD